jgi:hypothetical protein
VDLLSPLQREAVGTRYQLEMLLLYKNEAGEDFYVDTIHLAKAPTTNNIPGITQFMSCYSWFRDPPPTTSRVQHSLCPVIVGLETHHYQQHPGYDSSYVLL